MLPNQPTHGLNVHATLLGSYVTELGILHLENDNDLVEAARLARVEGKDERAALEVLYCKLGAPFIRTLIINAGDILIFQAEQFDGTRRKVAATVHDFETVSDWRLFTVFRPHLGDEAIVQGAREDLAEKYDLKDQ